MRALPDTIIELVLHSLDTITMPALASAMPIKVGSGAAERWSTQRRSSTAFVAALALVVVIGSIEKINGKILGLVNGKEKNFTELGPFIGFLKETTSHYSFDELDGHELMHISDFGKQQVPKSSGLGSGLLREEKRADLQIKTRIRNARIYTHKERVSLQKRDTKSRHV